MHSYNYCHLPSDETSTGHQLPVNPEVQGTSAIVEDGAQVNAAAVVDKSQLLVGASLQPLPVAHPESSLPLSTATQMSDSEDLIAPGQGHTVAIQASDMVRGTQVDTASSSAANAVVVANSSVVTPAAAVVARAPAVVVGQAPVQACRSVSLLVR